VEAVVQCSIGSVTLGFCHEPDFAGLKTRESKSVSAGDQLSGDPIKVSLRADWALPHHFCTFVLRAILVPILLLHVPNYHIPFEDTTDPIFACAVLSLFFSFPFYAVISFISTFPINIITDYPAEVKSKLILLDSGYLQNLGQTTRKNGRHSADNNL